MWGLLLAHFVVFSIRARSQTLNSLVQNDLFLEESSPSIMHLSPEWSPERVCLRIHTLFHKREPQFSFFWTVSRKGHTETHKQAHSHTYRSKPSCEIYSHDWSVSLCCTLNKMDLQALSQSTTRCWIFSGPGHWTLLLSNAQCFAQVFLFLFFSQKFCKKVLESK